MRHYGEKNRPRKELAAIKDEIKRLIQTESPLCPYNDQDLANAIVNNLTLTIALPKNFVNSIRGFRSRMGYANARQRLDAYVSENLNVTTTKPKK